MLRGPAHDMKFAPKSDKCSQSTNHNDNQYDNDSEEDRQNAIRETGRGLGGGKQRDIYGRKNTLLESCVHSMLETQV